jgi:PAS domain S-box-containing protein
MTAPANREYRAHFIKKKEVALDTWEFSCTAPADFVFEAGQYVWVVLYDDAKKELGRRAFSLTNSIYNKEELTFLCKDTHSAYKKALLHLANREAIKIIGPFGSSFTTSNHRHKHLILLAGGVGIAPFLSLLRSGTLADKSVTLIYSASSEELRCFQAELQELCEQQHCAYIPRKGHFGLHTLPEDLDYHQATIFVCGTQGYVTAVGAVLEKLAIPADNIVYEQYFAAPPQNLTRADFADPALHKSVMYKALQDSKSHAVITDANGIVLFANKAAEKTTGYTIDEMLGNTPRLWGGLMERDFYKEFWKRKRQQGGFDGELLNRRKNGELYTVIAHISPILSNDGQVIGYIGTEEDVSEERRYKEKLEQQNTQLERGKRAMLNILEDLQAEKQKIESQHAKDKALLLSVGDGLIVTDEHGVVELINPAGEELLQWSAADIVGKRMADVVALYNAHDQLLTAEHRPVYRTLFERKKSLVVHGKYLKKDGTKLPVVITTSPIVVGTKILGAVEVFRDVTKEEQIDKAKTEFISLASHQLRTPLSTINWYCEMLLAGDAGPLTKEQRDFLTEAYQGGRRLVGLVNALLNVSRIEAGSFAVDPEEVDLIKLIKSVITESQPLAKNKQLTVTLQKEKIPVLMLDSHLTLMIVQNLLTNALKYTPRQGSVKVSVEIVKKGAQLAGKKVHHDAVMLQVKDSGIGIPTQQQADIFQKMFRADNARKSDTEGTGLGLYMIKSLIEHSNGSIWFESKEGKGTTFFVLLPLSGMIKKEGSKQLTID